MQRSGEYERLRARARALNPLIVEAIDDLDPELLRDALALSPFERLRVCSEHLRYLTSLRRAVPEHG